MRYTLPSLSDLDSIAREPDLDRATFNAVRDDVLHELARIRVDAERALASDEFRDYRGDLVKYLSGTARLWGRSAAQQVRSFLDQGDELFRELSFRALGVAL